MGSSAVLCAQCQMHAGIDQPDPAPGTRCQLCRSIYDPEHPRRDFEGWRRPTAVEKMKEAIDELSW